MSQSRPVRAPRGTKLTCKSWLTEAAYRMIQNNLDPEVAEKPDDLVVYGGRGQAARDWDSFEAILESLKQLEDDETLLVQSGKPVAIFTTHTDAPRVLLANSNLVPHWATQEHFDEHAARCEIGDAAEFVCLEARRLRERYPRIMVAPLFYLVEDGNLYQINEENSAR